MRELLDLLIWLLIPAGLLPVVTAWYLRPVADLDSAAWRDRWHLSLVLAAFGLVTSVLALIEQLGLDWGDAPVLLFVGVILAVDVVSGKWLVDYWTGSLSQYRSSSRPETPIEREDRQVGDTRRELQEQAAEDE